MSAKMTGLGRGLDALIRETSAPSGPDSPPSLLPINSIIPNPDQPRKSFSDKSLDELASSIKSQGLLQPILVRPCGDSKPGAYEIVAGERRWRACKRAGLIDIPVIVRSLSTKETLLAALVENLQREDLNPIEEALGIEVLRDNFSLSQDELSQRIGKSRSAISNCLRLLSLPVAIQETLASGAISAGHARAILSIEDEEAQMELRDYLVKNKSSVREAESLATQWKKDGTFEISAKNKNLATKTSPKIEMSEEIKTLQGSLGKRFSLPVKISGTEQKGRISISYSSDEELKALLSKMGLN